MSRRRTNTEISPVNKVKKEKNAKQKSAKQKKDEVNDISPDYDQDIEHLTSKETKKKKTSPSACLGRRKPTRNKKTPEDTTLKKNNSKDMNEPQESSNSSPCLSDKISDSDYLFVMSEADSSMSERVSPASCLSSVSQCDNSISVMDNHDENKLSPVKSIISLKQSPPLNTKFSPNVPCNQLVSRKKCNRSVTSSENSLDIKGDKVKIFESTFSPINNLPGIEINRDSDFSDLIESDKTLNSMLESSNLILDSNVFDKNAINNIEQITPKNYSTLEDTVLPNNCFSPKKSFMLLLLNRLDSTTDSKENFIRNQLKIQPLIKPVNFNYEQSSAFSSAVDISLLKAANDYIKENAFTSEILPLVSPEDVPVTVWQNNIVRSSDIYLNLSGNDLHQFNSEDNESEISISSCRTMDIQPEFFDLTFSENNERISQSFPQNMNPVVNDVFSSDLNECTNELCSTVSQNLSPSENVELLNIVSDPCASKTTSKKKRRKRKLGYYSRKRRCKRKENQDTVLKLNSVISKDILCDTCDESELDEPIDFPTNHLSPVEESECLKKYSVSCNQPVNSSCSVPVERDTESIDSQQLKNTKQKKVRTYNTRSTCSQIGNIQTQSHEEILPKFTDEEFCDTCVESELEKLTENNSERKMSVSKVIKKVGNYQNVEIAENSNELNTKKLRLLKTDLSPNDQISCTSNQLRKRKNKDNSLEINEKNSETELPLSSKAENMTDKDSNSHSDIDCHKSKKVKLQKNRIQDLKEIKCSVKWSMLSDDLQDYDCHSLDRVQTNSDNIEIKTKGKNVMINSNECIKESNSITNQNKNSNPADDAKSVVECNRKCVNEQHLKNRSLTVQLDRLDEFTLNNYSKLPNVSEISKNDFKFEDFPPKSTDIIASVEDIFVNEQGLESMISKNYSPSKSSSTYEVNHAKSSVISKNCGKDKLKDTSTENCILDVDGNSKTHTSKKDENITLLKSEDISNKNNVNATVKDAFSSYSPNPKSDSPSKQLNRGKDMSVLKCVVLEDVASSENELDDPVENESCLRISGTDSNSDNDAYLLLKTKSQDMNKSNSELHDKLPIKSTDSSELISSDTETDVMFLETSLGASVEISCTPVSQTNPENVQFINSKISSTSKSCEKSSNIKTFKPVRKKGIGKKITKVKNSSDSLTKTNNSGICLTSAISKSVLPAKQSNTSKNGGVPKSLEEIESSKNNLPDPIKNASCSPVLKTDYLSIESCNTTKLLKSPANSSTEILENEILSVTNNTKACNDIKPVQKKVTSKSKTKKGKHIVSLAGDNSDVSSKNTSLLSVGDSQNLNHIPSNTNKNDSAPDSLELKKIESPGNNLDDPIENDSLQIRTFNTTKSSKSPVNDSADILENVISSVTSNTKVCTGIKPVNKKITLKRNSTKNDKHTALLTEDDNSGVSSKNTSLLSVDDSQSLNHIPSKTSKNSSAPNSLELEEFVSLGNNLDDPIENESCSPVLKTDFIKSSSTVQSSKSPVNDSADILDNVIPSVTSNTKACTGIKPVKKKITLKRNTKNGKHTASLTEDDNSGVSTKNTSLLSVGDSQSLNNVPSKTSKNSSAPNSLELEEIVSLRNNLDDPIENNSSSPVFKTDSTSIKNSNTIQSSKSPVNNSADIQENVILSATSNTKAYADTKPVKNKVTSKRKTKNEKLTEGNNSDISSKNANLFSVDDSQSLNQIPSDTHLVSEIPKESKNVSETRSSECKVNTSSVNDKKAPIQSSSSNVSQSDDFGRQKIVSPSKCVTKKLVPPETLKVNVTPQAKRNLIDVKHNTCSFKTSEAESESSENSSSTCLSSKSRNTKTSQSESEIKKLKAAIVPPDNVNISKGNSSLISQNLDCLKCDTFTAVKSPTTSPENVSVPTTKVNEPITTTDNPNQASSDIKKGKDIARKKSNNEKTMHPKSSRDEKLRQNSSESPTSSERNSKDKCQNSGCNSNEKLNSLPVKNGEVKSRTDFDFKVEQFKLKIPSSTEYLSSIVLSPKKNNKSVDFVANELCSDVCNTQDSKNYDSVKKQLNTDSSKSKPSTVKKDSKKKVKKPEAKQNESSDCVNQTKTVPDVTGKKGSKVCKTKSSDSTNCLKGKNTVIVKNRISESNPPRSQSSQIPKNGNISETLGSVSSNVEDSLSKECIFREKIQSMKQIPKLSSLNETEGIGYQDEKVNEKSISQTKSHDRISNTSPLQSPKNSDFKINSLNTESLILGLTEEDLDFEPDQQDMKTEDSKDSTKSVSNLSNIGRQENYFNFFSNSSVQKHLSSVTERDLYLSDDNMNKEVFFKLVDMPTSNDRSFERDLPSEDDSDSEEEHSFKRSRYERRNIVFEEPLSNCFDSKVCEDLQQQSVQNQELVSNESHLQNFDVNSHKSGSIINTTKSDFSKAFFEDQNTCHSNSDKASLNSVKSVVSSEHLLHIKDVVVQIKEYCDKEMGIEAVNIARKYIEISPSNDVNKSILRKLFSSLFSFIFNSNTQDPNAISELCEEVLKLMHDYDLYSKQTLSDFIINCCMQPELNIYSVKMFHICQNKSIPLNTKAINEFSSLLKSEEISLPVLLDYLEYVKSVCNKKISKELTHLAFEKCKLGKFSELHRMCSFLSGVTLREASELDLKEFLQMCFKEGMSAYVAEMFVMWNTKKHLSTCIYMALAEEGENMEKYYEKFAKAVHEREEIQHPELKKMFGQIGTALMLYAYSKNHLETADEILNILHTYNVNYFELELAANKFYLSQSYSDGDNYEMEILPFSVVFIAVDICLHFNRPKDAFTIFQDFSWVTPDENLDKAVTAYVLKERYQRLLKLVSLLNNEDSLNEGWEALKILIAVEQDFTEEKSEINNTGSNQDVSQENPPSICSIYNKYLISLLNSGKISSAFDLYQHSLGTRKDVFVIDHNVLRGLVVAFSNYGMDKIAKSIFTLGLLRNVYSIRKPELKSFPWDITISSDWTIFEIKLVIEWFAGALLPLLLDKPKDTNFEKWFSIKILFKVVEQKSTINCLADTDSDPKSYIDKTKDALMSMNPSLGFTEEKNETALLITSESLYNYWKKRCSDAGGRPLLQQQKKRLSFGVMNVAIDAESSVPLLNEEKYRHSQSVQNFQMQSSTNIISEWLGEMKASTSTSYSPVTPESSPCFVQESEISSLHNSEMNNNLQKLTDSIIQISSPTDKQQKTPNNDALNNSQSKNSKSKGSAFDSLRTNDFVNCDTYFTEKDTEMTEKQTTNKSFNKISPIKMLGFTQPTINPHLNSIKQKIKLNRRLGKEEHRTQTLATEALKLKLKARDTLNSPSLKSNSVSKSRVFANTSIVTAKKKKANVNIDNKFTNFTVCLSSNTAGRIVSNSSEDVNMTSHTNKNSQINSTTNADNADSEMLVKIPVQDSKNLKIAKSNVEKSKEKLNKPRTLIMPPNKNIPNPLETNVSSQLLVTTPVRDSNVQIQKQESKESITVLQKPSNVVSSQLICTVPNKNVCSRRVSDTAVSKGMTVTVNVPSNNAKNIPSSTNKSSKPNIKRITTVNKDFICETNVNVPVRTVSSLHRNHVPVTFEKKEQTGDENQKLKTTKVLSTSIKTTKPFPGNASAKNSTCNQEEFNRIYQFLMMKVKLKHNHLSPVEQDHKARILTETFINSSENFTKLDKRVMNLLVKFATSNI